MRLRHEFVGNYGTGLDWPAAATQIRRRPITTINIGTAQSHDRREAAVVAFVVFRQFCV